MGMQDITTEIKFGAASAVNKEQIQQSKMDIIKYKQTQAAHDLGEKICDVKGWKMRPEGDLCISEINLYVFTPLELKNYIEAKIKSHLLLMAERV